MKLLAKSFLCLALFGRAQAESQCTLADPIVLDQDGLVTLEQVANQASGTFTMRLTYSGGQSWIGIGINQQGTSNMTPATAVIGRFLNGAPSVLKYNLQSTNQDASGVIPMDTGLQNLQDATFTQTGSTSVLEFTQELNDATQQVSNDSVWIYAVGLPDNQWEGKHAIHGAFQITLDENCGGDNGSSGNTDSSANSDGIVSLQDPAEATRSLWIAHGFLMAIAWGICAPIAIGAVLLRNVSFLAENGHWYKIHFYLNITNGLCTSIGFFLAVAATNQVGDEHFTEETHKKVGLAIFIIVLFQIIVAFFRPSPPKANQQETKSVQRASSLSAGTPGQSVDQAVNIDSEHMSDTEHIEEDSVTYPLENKQPTKSKARFAWEILHRSVGVSLIGMAWYNCNRGIELQVENYGESDDLTAVFWGVTGAISGLICLAYVVRLFM